MVTHDERLRELERGGRGDFARAWRGFLHAGELPISETMLREVLTAARSAPTLVLNGDLPGDHDAALARLSLLDRCCADADDGERRAARAELQLLAAAEAVARRKEAPWRGPHDAAAPAAPTTESTVAARGASQAPTPPPPLRAAESYDNGTQP
jgi:hypothetical protein